MVEAKSKDIADRLTRCFSAVFPELGAKRIPSATLETVENWDSIHTVTLVTALEEEFGIEFDLDALERCTSYRAILDYLEVNVGAPMNTDGT